MEAIRTLGGVASYGVPGTFFTLTRSALQQNPDVISLDWIHQYALSPSMVASLIKSFAFWLDVLIVKYILSKKLVWTLHNLQHHEERPRKLERWISGFFARQCEKVRLLGEGIETEVCQRFGLERKKLVVIPEGSYIDWYPNNATQSESRSKLSIPQERRVWLYFGNLRPYKGVEDLIRAFKEIQPPETTLVIAGNPYHRSYAESLVQLADSEKNIRLDMQAVPDAELQYYFHMADLVVLPFRHVLNSGTVLLAMGFGKAIVAPATGLIPFRLSAQKELLYSENENLTDALRRVLAKNTSDLESIGKHNRVAALRYQWTDFAQFLLSLS